MKKGERGMQSVEDREKKVSVIIPIYNGEKYIGETMSSVINQTYKNLEVLCIIDGTKDQSKEIIEALADPRISVMEQENHGATWTRNRGISLVTGDYVWFLDQDDNLMPGCIEAAVAEIERTGSVGVAVNGHLIDSNSQIIRRMYRFNKPILSLRKLVKGNQLSTTSQVLLRREAMLSNGGFDIDAGMADDWEMWIRVVRDCKLIFLDQYLMQYRLHESNQSKNFEKMFRNEMHIVDEKLRDRQDIRAIRSYSYLRYSSRAANWRLLFTALWFNAYLLFTLRFYWTVGQIVITRLKWNMKKTGGVG
jgi:glycosyltransferase involved in cell wall biosynthesis